MKEKIVSLILGVIIGSAGVVGYNHFTKPDFPAGGMGGGFGGQMEMTDERLTQMAERLGMTKEELQKELDSGKDIRTLMQEKGISRGNGEQNRQQSGQ